jgi:hypothetical protein
MINSLRLPLAAVLATACLAVLVPAASAATTYYAAPSGSGSTCSQASPCKIEEAVNNKAEDGDSVVLEPGTYVLGPSWEGIYHTIDFGGQPGAAPAILQTSATENVHVSDEAKATVHDVTITGGGGFVFSSGLAERVFVNFTGTYSTGCAIAVNTILRDSVCWSHDGGTGAYAADIDAPGIKGTATLRNDTFISAESSGILAQASGGGELTVDAANLIVRGLNGNADITTTFSGFSTAFVQIASSDYRTIEELPPFTTVTAPNTNGNISDEPVFVSASTGNFAEAAGSPTIDRGLTDSLIGSTDLLGSARSQPACIGGTPVPDLGAYEFVPTEHCPTASSFKFGKLTLNKKKGTATLELKAPGAGKFTLSGKGVKKVTRTVKGAANPKLTVSATGKWKQTLQETGGLKVKLKVKFEPNGNKPLTKEKKLTLRKTT